MPKYNRSHVSASSAIAILVILALPLSLGSIWPSLFPIDEDSVAVISEDGTVKAHPFPTEKAFAVQHRQAQITFGIVASSCIAASIALGFLYVKWSFLYAVVLASIATYAWLPVDGQGAFMSPIMFALLPFWPLIGLGKLFRKAFRPRGICNVAPVRLPLHVAASRRLQNMANELLAKIETASSWSQYEPLAQEFAQALLDAGVDEGDVARTLRDMHVSEWGSVQIITAARTRQAGEMPSHAPADPKPPGQ